MNKVMMADKNNTNNSSALDEYIRTPEAQRKQREAVEEAREYIQEWHKRARINVESYARRKALPANAIDPPSEKLSGQLSLTWEIASDDWLVFKIGSGKDQHEFCVEKGWKGISDRVQREHFEANLETVLFRAALQLAEASVIFSSQTVLRTNPHLCGPHAAYSPLPRTKGRR